MLYKKRYFIYLTALVVFLLILCVVAWFTKDTWYKPGAQSAAAAMAEENQTPAIDPFANISLQAKAALVWDPSTDKVLFAKNANAPLPLASLTKIMSAVVAKDILKTPVSITLKAEDLSPEGDTGLKVGEVWQSDDLLRFSLLVSSNDGITAIAAAAGQKNFSASHDSALNLFVIDMNQKAAALSLKTLSFQTPTGLDLDNQTEASATGSAQDIARLFMRGIRLYPEIFEVTRHSSMVFSSSVAVHSATNTDEVAADIPGLIASKTGYTDVSGGNLIISFNIGLNHPVVIVVLGSTFDGRFSDIQTLVKATRDYYFSS